MNRIPDIKFLFRLLLPALFLCVALGCRTDHNRLRVDWLNDIAYRYHYRNLDSTRVYASRALSAADDYPDGRAEALNNLAFVSIAKMNYRQADSLLDEALGATDNQIELLVGNVQQMRLCQRMSDSKNFYNYRQKAEECMNRLHEDERLFSLRQQRRVAYARSEYSVVLSTYLYYMGQRSRSSAALADIDPAGPIVKDTAQLLAYYYNVGSGGVLSAKSNAELMQSEFDYLMRCYLLSRQYHYVFWEANSLQAISEHMLVRSDRHRLMSDNMQEFDFLNIDQMPDSLLAGNLAQRALELFEQYGDVYQVAGAWRTLSEAYRAIGDYESALVCLENALSKNAAINAAPDLVASIREQLSIVYSAMDNKPQSDKNRNIYLDLQERTRQDRFLEARAEQLDDSLHQLDVMIVSVVVLIVVVVAMLVYFYYWQHRHNDIPSMDVLRQPFEEWKKRNVEREEQMKEQTEETEEDILVANRKLERLQEQNVEQRAKVWLASTVTPLVGRMLHEVECLETRSDSAEVRASRLAYISQLTDSIDVCNRQLTHWIKLRQGDFLLRIESFALKDLFDTLRQNSANFRLAGVSLDVADTDAIVKADRTLTLFMLNTIAGNARRYTPAGGCVRIGADVNDDYVEVSVADTGCGMDEEKARGIFSNRVVIDGDSTDGEGGHGFGLVNCKGIIEKYHKLSAIFSVCSIGVESKVGEGSRFFFRLPKGAVRVVGMLVAICVWLFTVPCRAAVPVGNAGSYKAFSTQAGIYADSAYFSNINGNYEKTVAYADSCLRCLNAAYTTLSGHGSRRVHLLRLNGDYPANAAELYWFRDSAMVDYSVLLDVRNETAVAALALHRWGLYAYNNAVYTQLFRMCSADNSISAYVRSMQMAENNRNIAIIMLVAMLLAIFPTYYVLYYRHRMNYHMYVDRINAVNGVLADDGIASAADKLAAIRNIWRTECPKLEQQRFDTNAVGPEGVYALVEEIMSELRGEIDNMEKLQDRRVLASDELRRVEMDCDRLYVSNNVLDNCLSSLKHETMYYPSRLRQIVSSADNRDSIGTLGEMAGFYQQLYSTLISQALNILQGAGALARPKFLMHYMMAILKKKNGNIPLTVVKKPGKDGYVQIYITICNKVLADAVGDTPNVLFSPDTPDVDFLICCQIMRDIGEYTGLRGCGISARADTDGQLTIEVCSADIKDY